MVDIRRFWKVVHELCGTKPLAIAVQRM